MLNWISRYKESTSRLHLRCNGIHTTTTLFYILAVRQFLRLREGGAEASHLGTRIEHVQSYGVEQVFSLMELFQVAKAKLGRELWRSSD